MEWIGELLGVGATAVSGGLFGFIGGLGSSIMKFFTQKQEFKQKQAQWAHEKEMVKLTTDGEVTKASWEALKASHENESKSSFAGRWAIVDAIKTLYRPALTSALLFFVYLLFQDILEALGGKNTALASVFTGTELKEILKYIVHSVVFTAMSAAMWWFSERAFAPPGMKNR